MQNEHGSSSAAAGVHECDRQARDAATRRLAACLMVLFALLLAVLTWFSNEVNTTYASSLPSEDADSQRSAEADFVPSGRTRQGTEVEEHIQAF